MKKNITLLAFIVVTLLVTAIPSHDVFAYPGTYKTVGGQAFCGSLLGGATVGGACDTAVNTGNYRGAGLGQNQCRILNCTY